LDIVLLIISPNRLGEEETMDLKEGEHAQCKIENRKTLTWYESSVTVPPKRARTRSSAVSSPTGMPANAFPGATPGILTANFRGAIVPVSAE